MDSRYQRNGTMRGVTVSPQNRNGPLYTMSGSGGQVLMNAKNIISATNIQFLPSVRAKSCSMAMEDHVKPINTFVPTLGYPLLTSIKGFFSSLIRPIIGQSNKIVADTTILTPSEYLPAANLSDNNDNNCNIYMNFMPDLTSLSFLDYDEYEHDRLDSPVDLKRFDLNDVSNVTDTTTTKDDSPPSNDILSPGVDTTDFASSLAVPRFETKQIESLHPQCVDTVMEKNVSQPLEKKMDLLPPAVGQTTGKMAERMTQEISHSQKTACAANGNRTKRHRRAARNNMQGSKCGSKRAVAISKNRNVKSRQELAQNIHDDLEDCTMDAHWAEDEDDDDHIDVEMVMAPTLNVSETITRPERADMTEEKRPGCIFTTFFNFGFGGRSLCKPWPMSTSKLAPYSKQQNQTTQSPRCRLNDSESDDSFIMFAEDSPKTTPTVETVLQNSMGIKGMANPFYSCMRKKAVTRQRQLSECSDDFICFEYDGDHVDGDQEDDEDDVFDNSDSESESDSDDESNFAEESESESDIDDEHLSTGTYQPDSGFEEKKVTFNLCPIVHEIRAWKFAYCEARKGKWEEAGRDRERFTKRVREAESVLSPILASVHRERIFKQRFSQKDTPATTTAQSSINQPRTATDKLLVVKMVLSCDNASRMSGSTELVEVESKQWC